MEIIISFRNEDPCRRQIRRRKSVAQLVENYIVFKATGRRRVEIPQIRLHFLHHSRSLVISLLP